MDRLRRKLRMLFNKKNEKMLFYVFYAVMSFFMLFFLFASHVQFPEEKQTISCSNKNTRDFKLNTSLRERESQK